MATRGPNGRSPVLFDEERGDWHGYVSLGTDQLTGRRRRRHLRAPTRAALMRKIQKLESQRESGEFDSDGVDATVEGWLREWLTVVHDTRSHQTYSKADWACRLYLIPALGNGRLAKLTTSDVLTAISSLSRTGRGNVVVPASEKTRQAVLIQLVTALNEAVRQRRLVRNPAAYVRMPRPEPIEVDPLTRDEIAAVLEAAARRRNGVRWTLAIALGLRQSEALGLRWVDVDLDAKMVQVRKQLGRLSWAHGCGRAGACGAAAKCPSRVRRSRETVLKTRASRRTLHLPDPLVEALRAHRRAQAEARLLAAEMWSDTGYVFTSAVGTPLEQRNDLRDWTALLKRAGLSPTRIHDLRHTNATLLLLAGVQTRVVQELMGWSTTSMATRYQHVVSELSQSASETIAAALFGHSTEVAGRQPADRADAVPAGARSHATRVLCVPPRTAPTQAWILPSWPRYRSTPP